MERNGVEESLHHYRRSCGREHWRRFVQAKERLAFVEQARIRRVQVLRLTAAFNEAAAKGDDLPPTANRDHQPRAKAVVVAFPARAGHREASGLERWRGDTGAQQRFGQVRPACWRVAQPPSSPGLFADGALPKM